jgi:short-subunit dehydrogenase
VRTEFHQRMDVGRDSAPRFLWLDPEFVVRRALADLDGGKVFSIPSARYRAIVGVARYVPAGVLQRFQSFGRK